MSDRFPARIEIGGKLKRSQLAKFVKLLDENGLDFDWASFEDMTESRLLSYLNEGPPESLTLMNSEAYYGHFEDLEKFLDDEGFWFIRTSDSYCDYEAEVVTCTPEQAPESLQGDQGGDAVVPMSKVEEALQCFRDGDAFGAIAKLEALVRSIPTVPPFEIIDDTPPKRRRSRK